MTKVRFTLTKVRQDSPPALSGTARIATRRAFNEVAAHMVAAVRESVGRRGPVPVLRSIVGAAIEKRVDVGALTIFKG